MNAPTSTGPSAGVGSSSDSLGIGRGSSSEARRIPADDQNTIGRGETPRGKTKEHEKREHEGEDAQKDSPSKSQKKSNVTIRFGAFDKMD